MVTWGLFWKLVDLTWNDPHLILKEIVLKSMLSHVSDTEHLLSRQIIFFHFIVQLSKLESSLLPLSETNNKKILSCQCCTQLKLKKAICKLTQKQLPVTASQPFRISDRSALLRVSLITQDSFSNQDSEIISKIETKFYMCKICHVISHYSQRPVHPSFDWNTLKMPGINCPNFKQKMEHLGENGLLLKIVKKDRHLSSPK